MREVGLDNFSFIYVESFVAVVIELLITIGLQQMLLNIGSQAKRAAIGFFDNQEVANLDTVLIVDGPFIEIESNWRAISKHLIMRGVLSSGLCVGNARPNWNAKLSVDSELVFHSIIIIQPVLTPLSS